MYHAKHRYDWIYNGVQVRRLFPSDCLWRMTCLTWLLSPIPALWLRGVCCWALWGDCRKHSRASSKTTHDIPFNISAHHPLSLKAAQLLLLHIWACDGPSLLWTDALTSLCIARFTVKEDPDFGLLLESVNGVAGNEREETYWEILSESSGEYSRLGVGEFPPQSFSTTYLRKT